MANMNDNRAKSNVFNEDTKPNVYSEDRKMFLDRTQDRWRKCGRRVDRVDLEPTLHSVWITFPSLTQNLFKVVTIGELGAYCLHRGPKMVVGPDQIVSIVLIIGKEQFQFKGSIRFLKAGGIAVEFVDPPVTVREKIKTIFAPELLAAKLSPILSYATEEPGATATLIYSDGDSNWLHIALSSGKTLAVFLDLDILNIRLTWRKAEMRKSGDFSGDVDESVIRKKVLSFIRNLPGMSSDFFTDIESILTTGRVD